MQSARIQNSATVPAKRKKVPDYLIKETIDGIPFYYPGYKKVINKKAVLEDIMGWSGLQGIIVAYLTQVLFAHLNLRKYRILPGETGNHLEYKSNLSLDVSIFEKNVLTPEKINTKYIDVPAYCVIEVDVQVEWDESLIMSEFGFVTLKTQKLFDFGTQKLIWVLSKSQKVLVAEPKQHWKIIDWNEDIELIDGVTFNIGKYLKEEGIEPITDMPSGK